MKNKILHIAIAYWFLVMALVLFISGCRTKKSTTDFKETKIENVSITDNSTISKMEMVQENNHEKKNETVTDKSFFEAWMEIKSDEAAFEDKSGNKWTFKNPQMNKKSSQSNNMLKTEQTDSNSNKIVENEENQQNDVKTDTSKETKIDLKQKDSSKGKEPFWMYVIIGAVIVICFVVLLNKYSKKSN